MINVVNSTIQTGISMSAQGIINPLKLADIPFKTITIQDFTFEYETYKHQRCILIPIPSAWKFHIKEDVMFTSIFVCESNAIRQTDIDKLKRIHDIWVPSTFCQNVLKKYDLPSKLIPYSIPSPIIMPTKTQEHFTFMCSFDGKFTIIRKGVKDTIDAFKLAFPDNKNVRLLVKTFDLDNNKKKTIEQYINNDERITILNKSFPTTDEIYNNIDCYVSLHTSEGFGRHIAEALYRQIPVIVSNHGGNTDYCLPETSYLVNGSMTSHTVDAQYRWEGEWLQPNIEEAIEAMKEVFTNYDKAKIKAKAGANLVHLLYNTKHISKLIKQVL